MHATLDDVLRYLEGLRDDARRKLYAANPDTFKLYFERRIEILNAVIGELTWDKEHSR